MTALPLSTRLELMVIVGSTPGLDARAHAEAAIRGGASAIQLRMKDTSTRRIVEAAREIQTLTAAAGALLIVNDRVDVALATGADGAHLGDDDLPLDVARRIVPDGFLLGRSVDDEKEAVAAATVGADYIGLGPVFPTPSKGDTGPVVGLEGVERVRRHVTLPFVGIGGVDLESAADVIRAGADGVAVIGAVSKAADPEGAARALLARIREAKR